jgi:hypothetical protein
MLVQFTSILSKSYLTIEDLAVSTSDFRVGANEFDSNASPAKVRSHREVGDRCNHGDGSCDVVENTVLARLGSGETNESDCCRDHDCCHGPVPIRTANGDGDVGVRVVDGIVWGVVSERSVNRWNAESLPLT